MKTWIDSAFAFRQHVIYFYTGVMGCIPVLTVQIICIIIRVSCTFLPAASLQAR